MTWSQFMLENCGYETISTFWEDFSIADQFGAGAIQDTFNRAFKEWKSDYKMLTELIMVLNHKIWYHNEKHKDYAELYNNLWEQAHNYALTNLKDDALAYYYEITD